MHRYEKKRMRDKVITGHELTLFYLSFSRFFLFMLAEKVKRMVEHILLLKSLSLLRARVIVSSFSLRTKNKNKDFVDFFILIFVNNKNKYNKTKKCLIKTI